LPPTPTLRRSSGKFYKPKPTELLLPPQPKPKKLAKDPEN